MQYVSVWNAHTFRARFKGTFNCNLKATGLCFGKFICEHQVWGQIWLESVLLYGSCWFANSLWDRRWQGNDYRIWTLLVPFFQMCLSLNISLFKSAKYFFLSVELHTALESLIVLYIPLPASTFPFCSRQLRSLLLITMLLWEIHSEFVQDFSCVSLKSSEECATTIYYDKTKLAVIRQ